MPIFEYKCTVCGSRFERILNREAKSIQCVACGSVQSQRLISAFAVSSRSPESAAIAPGPCPCGSPQRGMCGDG